MIFENIEFHNVAELERVPGISGYKLQRFPKEVRNALGHEEHERGRFYVQKPVGCEIRFVTDAKFIRVSLSAVDQDGLVLIYRGNFFHSYHILKAGVITTLHLECPSKFTEVEADCLRGYSFSTDVWRLQFGKDAEILFHCIDTFGHSLRIPRKDEVPILKWLVYGSSITFGGNALLYSNAYIQQAARRLGVDVLNKAIAGSCFCEKIVANYLADCEEWDFIMLELGVNMRGRFTVEEYEIRVKYLLEKIIEKNPTKPIIVTGIYPNSALYSLDKKNSITSSNYIFEQVLSEIIKNMSNENLYYIPGKDILTDFSGLCTDLLHPSDYGHIIIGEDLSRKLELILKKRYQDRIE